MAAPGGNMEVVVVAQIAQYLQAMKEGAAANVALGKTLLEMSGGFKQLPGSIKPAEKAVEGIEQKFASFKRGEIQEGKLIGFYVRELTSFTGISAGVQSAIGGVTEGLLGLASASGPMLAVWAGFELFKGVAAGVGEVVGAQKKAREEAIQWGVEMRKELVSMVDLAQELADKLSNVTPVQKAKRVEDNIAAAVARLEKEKADIVARRALMMAESGKLNPSAAFTEYVGDASIFKTSQAEQDRFRLKAIEEGIADARTKSLGVLKAEASEAQEITRLRRAEADREIAADLYRSRVAGNVDYEMAGGDGGVSLAVKALDAARQKNEQMSATAASISAKARHASAEEIELLRVKGELLTLNAQLASAASSSEEQAIRRLIQAARDASRDRMNDLALERAARENADETDWLARQETLDAIRRKKETWARNTLTGNGAQSADEANFPMAFGDEGLAASVAAKTQVKIAQDLKDAWMDVGAAMSGAFSALGNAIGGAAGRFLSTIGEMISQAIKFAIAMAAASVAQTPVIGGLMAAAAAIGLATSLVATIASVPSYDVGTSYVPQTGLALIHKGEAIITAEDNARGAGRGSNVNVTLNVTAMDGRDVYRTLTGSRSQLARVVREAVRDGVM